MSTEIYSGNPNLKKANTPITWTAELIEEWEKCQKNPVYFCRTYVKIVSLDEGVVPFIPRKFQEKLIKRFHKHRFNICKMPRQCGKMLSLDTPIPTPSGWTTIGELQIGEYIFGRDGNLTKVTGKSPIQKIDTYEIEFDNGEIIKACSEHLWKVSHSDWEHKEKVLPTKEILEKFNSLNWANKFSSLYINIGEAIDLPEIKLSIDPYTLGVWLGNGSMSDGSITGPYEDIEIISSNIPLLITKKYKDERETSFWKYIYDDLTQDLRALGLDKEKFIPENYLRSSISQRLELLKGLMDADGIVTPNGECSFYQKDGKLLHQTRELLSSLGIKSKIQYKKNPGYSELYGVLRFCPGKYNVFTLPRKLEKQKNNPDNIVNKRFYIKNIKKVETEPMQCIRVDSEDHLFLCGKSFIPTHNTTTVTSYLLHYIIFNDNVNIAILANKAQTAKEILGKLQLAYENLPKWMQHGVKIWNKASLELDNGSKILAASTSGSAVRGSAYNILVLDEFAFVPNQIAEEFFASVYPTVTSGKNTKVIMISTPKGMNMFYKFWTKAERGENEYIPTEVHWSEVPGRDEKWKQQTIANTSREQFEQEFESLGYDTLINIENSGTFTEIQIGELYNDLFNRGLT